MITENKGVSLNGYKHTVGNVVEYKGKEYVIEDARHHAFFSIKDANGSYLVLRSDIDGRLHMKDPVRFTTIRNGEVVMESNPDHPVYKAMAKAVVC